MTRPDWEELLRSEGERWARTPFVWHGTTKRGADCRGIIVGCLRATGIAVPTGDGSPYETHWFLHDRTRNRYLEGLLQVGREVTDRKPGDILAFWNQHKQKVVHSALLIDPDRILHCRHRTGGEVSRLADPIFRFEAITFVRLRSIETLLGEHADGG